MSKSKAKKQQQQLEQELKQAEQKILQNMDPTALKQQFYLHRKRVNDLIQQVNVLNVSIAQNNEKHLKQSYEFEQKLKQQEQERDEVRLKYENLVLNSKEKWTNKKKLWELEKKKQDSKRVHIVTQLSNKVRKFQNKIEKIKQFRSKQNEYLKTIDELEKKLQRSNNIHEQELNRLENEHVKIRQINTKIKNDKIQNIKDNEYKRIRRMIDDRDKSIFIENNLLKDQKNLYKTQEDSLLEQKQKLKFQIRQQEKILKDLETLNPQQQNYERSLKIVNLQDRIAELKKIHEENNKKYGVLIEEQQKKYVGKIKQLQKGIKENHNSFKQKQKQVKDLKMYAQMVLDQRKPLEWYVLEVLSDNPKEQVNRIVELDNILRQLFIKINSGIPPKNWRNSLKQNITIFEAGRKELDTEQVSIDWPSQMNQSISSQYK